MAVNENEIGTVQTQATAPAPQPTTQRQAQRPTGAPGSTTGINHLMRRSGRLDGSDARSADALQVFTKVKEEAIRHQDLPDDFDIHRFDRDAQQVGMAGLLIVKLAKDINGSMKAFVRTLVLDNLPGTRIRPRTHKINNGLTDDIIEEKVLPRDVFTAQYWSKIGEFLRNRYNIPGLEVLSAGPRAVYADFDFKDELAVKNLLVESVNICEDAIARRNNETPFSIATHIKAENEQLTCNLDYNGIPVKDSCGNPIRSDLVISTSRGKKTNVPENEFYDTDSQLNQVSLFVDLHWTPTTGQQQGMFGVTLPGAVLPPQFTPYIVITDVRKASWIQAWTLEMWLFALGNAYRATASQAWARTLMPKIATSKMRDIGALGYYSELGKAIETRTEAFMADDSNFVMLMNKMVNQNPAFQIDIDPMGDNSAIEQVILDAAGGVNQARAVSLIFQALTNLYGTDFRQFYNLAEAGPIIFDNHHEVDLGHYTDEHGELSDRRDLDVLGAMNMSEGNDQEWKTWYATQVGNDHIVRRMNNSKGFDKMYLGNVTYTGRARRLTFNPKFITAMDAAAAAAGVTVTMENLITNFGQQRFAGYTGMGNMAVSGSAQVGMAGSMGQTYGAPSYNAPGTWY
ncbi:hypothetical protein [Pseudomonas phage vB_PaeM_kmuB]|nr:hypothetical protein [Pseudomonas phage vB_PaeM_kmuB]